MRRICLGLITVVLFAGVIILPGCVTSAPPEDISGAFSDALQTISDSTLERLNTEVADLDIQLTDAETRLNKLEQVTQPALEWIEETKAKAKSEHWGGTRVVRVTEDLDQLENDQYRVAQLELRVSQGAGVYLFDDTVLVEDVKTGKITPYQDITRDLQQQFENLDRQRKYKMQDWDLIKITIDDVINHSSGWTIEKLDETTYRISGEMLGWHSGLARGQWLYYTNTGTTSPTDTTSQALKRLLSGQ